MTSATPRRGYLSLGSNIGDSRANLKAATTALSQHGVKVRASSSVYETEPVGEVSDQPKFLNACIEIETELEPEALLDICKEIEREIGRSGGVRHGPRLIDVDILLLGEIEYTSERLTIPHRDISSRRFVLVPLLELNSQLDLPGIGSAQECLAALPDGEQEVRLTGPVLV